MVDFPKMKAVICDGETACWSSSHYRSESGPLGVYKGAYCTTLKTTVGETGQEHVLTGRGHVLTGTE